MNRKTGESENTDFDDFDWCVHAIASFVTKYAKGQRKPLSKGQTDNMNRTCSEILHLKNEK